MPSAAWRCRAGAQPRLAVRGWVSGLAGRAPRDRGNKCAATAQVRVCEFVAGMLLPAPGTIYCSQHVFVFRCRLPYGMTESYKFSNAKQARERI
eukprot:scaffold5694_cov124-Isochrysis_galbana.AAC.1